MTSKTKEQRVCIVSDDEATRKAVRSVEMAPRGAEGLLNANSSNGTALNDDTQPNDTDVLPQGVNEEQENMFDDEGLLDDLVATNKALEINNIVPRPIDKQVIVGIWVLKRKKSYTVRAKYAAKEIARTKDVVVEVLAHTPQDTSFKCHIAKSNAQLKNTSSWSVVTCHPGQS